MVIQCFIYLIFRAVIIKFIGEVGLKLFHLTLINVAVELEVAEFLGPTFLMCFLVIRVILVRLWLIRVIKLVNFIAVLLVYLF